jgi:hypothetical protein
MNRIREICFKLQLNESLRFVLFVSVNDTAEIRTKLFQFLIVNIY